METLNKEQKLKNFQLALAMVGISTNIMTCELIHAIAAMVDDKGADFNVGDAQKLSEGIQQKYNAAMGGQPKTPFPPTPLPQMKRSVIITEEKSAPKEFVEPEDLESEKTKLE